MKVYEKITHMLFVIIIAMVTAYICAYSKYYLNFMFNISVFLLVFLLAFAVNSFEKYEKIMITLPVRTEDIRYGKITC